MTQRRFCFLSSILEVFTNLQRIDAMHLEVGGMGMLLDCAIDYKFLGHHAEAWSPAATQYRADIMLSLAEREAVLVE